MTLLPREKLCLLWNENIQYLTSTLFVIVELFWSWTQIRDIVKIFTENVSHSAQTLNLRLPLKLESIICQESMQALLNPTQTRLQTFKHLRYLSKREIKIQWTVILHVSLYTLCWWHTNYGMTLVMSVSSTFTHTHSITSFLGTHA